MPYAAYFFLYLLLEALAFWGVSQLIGVGWALAGIFILMVVGAVGASGAMRAEMLRASHGQASIGQFAGGTALAMAGGALTVMPGYVTSAIGVLLLFRPTRELIRSSMAASLRKRIETFGVQVYDASAMGRRATSYGTFGPGDVIDAEPEPAKGEELDAEIEQWSRNARPEDFGGPSSGGGKGDK